MATTVGSKNPGFDQLTFDVNFPDRATCDPVHRSGALTPARSVALVHFEAAKAIQFTSFRDRISGAPGGLDALCR